MRITGGNIKGSQLSSFKGLDIRPTSDKIRESIFNLLGQNMEGFNVLDLFAGTGSLGIEALSRGAIRAIFVDNSVKSIKIINKNLEKCDFLSLGLVMKKDLSRGLPKHQPFLERPFDLVFIDPPYGRGLIPPLLKQISEMKLISENGIVITESRKTDILPDQQNGLTLEDSRRYGETKIDRYVLDK